MLPDSSPHGASPAAVHDHGAKRIVFIFINRKRGGSGLFRTLFFCVISVKISVIYSQKGDNIFAVFYIMNYNESISSPKRRTVEAFRVRGAGCVVKRNSAYERIIYQFNN